MALFLCLNTMEVLLWIILGIGILTHLSMKVWLAQGWKKASPSRQNVSQNPPISLLIAARNEAENLQRFLPSLLQQSYPDFEIIIALDRCEDDSLEVLKAFQQTHPRLRWVEIPETAAGWAPKKWALSQAIEAAKHEHLLFTDADCQAGEAWMSEMAAAFSAQRDVVLGLGRYFAYPGILNVFIRYETLYAAFQYVGMAGQGQPYMGVGRNLAYRKSLYKKVNGFETFRSSLSGDDDLFVNAFAEGKKTAVVIKKAGHTFSEPERRFVSWVRQKVRHVSASAKYSLRSKIFLASFHLSQIALYVALGGVLLFTEHVEAAILLYVVFLSISWYIFGKINHTVGEPALSACYPFLDILFVVYNLSMVPLGLIVKPEWKKKKKIPQKSPKIL